jgi:hypothetical protein
MKMDRRLRAVAGDNALNCGAVTVDWDRNPDTMLKCARKAIAKGISFYVRSDSWGMDSFLSEGFAGNGKGDVYYLNFDSIGWHPDRSRDEAGDAKSET